MATFSELITSKPINAAFLKKQSVVAELDNIRKAIGDLDRDSPNARTFCRIESSATESLEELKGATSELDYFLFKANPDITSDEDYEADKKFNRNCQFKLYNAIDNYTDLLKEKEIPYPPDKAQVPAPNPGDLADVLAQLVKCQTDSNAQLTAQLIKCQTDSAAAATAQQTANAT